VIARPKPGRRVALAYRPALRPVCPHGAKGRVLATGKGPGPLNHLVRLDDGRVLVVPCGHLVPGKE
jgi:hypothetical protein